MTTRGKSMKLNIENFAKIKNANINFNGITVIAGENNTGKSTVGKIMFSLFNSFNCMDEKIKKQINFSLINQLLRTTNIEFERLDVLESISKELIKADLSDGKHSIENTLKNYSRIVKIVDKKGIDEIWNILK
jgi:predicted ATPase